jgi:Flp pilus assembly protein TadG
MVSRYERGQALLEFALTLPIMLLLLVGILDLGRIVFTRNGMRDGARLVAR